MHPTRLLRGGSELLPRLEGLWNSLFAHHLSVGAAGLPTIPRPESWPLRRAHYERLASGPSGLSVWLALDGDSAVGYALAHEEAIGGERAQVLETLSVLPGIRGAGLGSRLMDAVDAQARERGIGVAAVDVMGGNARARSLYLRRGYHPHSESWMRSMVSEDRSAPLPPLGDLRARARALGFALEVSPGPDDTWVTPSEIVELSALAASEPPGAVLASPGDAARLASLFDDLERAGRWAIRCATPVAVGAGQLRRFLVSEGFAMSTERLLRRERAGRADEADPGPRS
ncbi:GNAT family N-acetyltransferase [Leucobacter sp. wl10]|uniref:GNAT family N-acetyltransferase n=1 Tax=Leucobacter sp. wl10 TaxID=2304677 RepID=UPI000E5A1DAD|nr:GNAT family N-acetyltransferase [Leucobacter sp. wl10]RGE18046.1 GNAT family N-acetyltransferase [Leucobacter sp. wl10]